jgi:hypothetical protein
MCAFISIASIELKSKIESILSVLHSLQHNLSSLKFVLKGSIFCFF